MLLTPSGCGPSKTPGAAADNAGNETAGATDSKPAKGKKKSNRKKGEQLGGVPKDVWPEVWLDDPSGVAAETGGARPVVMVPPPDKSRKNSPAMSSPTPDATASAAVAGTGTTTPDWVALLPGESFADEAKTIRANLTAKLQSVGQFNGAYREIQQDAAVLAALAQIAPQHSGAPSWKKNAPLVRDVADEVLREANSVGEKFYRPTRDAFDKLDSLLSGSVPPGLGEAVPQLAFHVIAPRFPLMKRFERAQIFLKSGVNSAELLKKESERVIREASLVATLAQVIAIGGYDDADDEEYQRLVAGVREGAQKTAAAARDQDFEAYTAALDLMYKSCTKCHSEFKNN